MKIESTLCSVDCSFDSSKTVEEWLVKLKNRRMVISHDGKNFLLYWKNLNKFGEVKRGGIALTPEAMEFIVNAYLCMERKPKSNVDYSPKICVYNKGEEDV